MPSRTRSRGKSSSSRGTALQDRAQLAARNAAGQWAKFTWATDTTRLRFAPIPHVAVNWVILALVSVVTYLAPGTWQVTLVVAFAGLVYTAARARRHLPARTKTTTATRDATATLFKHPRGTVAAPVSAKDRVQVTRWGSKPGQPLAGAVVYSPGSPAENPPSRAAAERSIETAIAPHLPAEHALVFTHVDGAHQWDTVPADDPAVTRQKTRRWVETTLHDLFPTKRGQEPTTITIAWDDEADRPDAPARVEVGIGAVDTTDLRARDKIETAFDQRLDRGVAWLYDWSVSGVLTIEGSPKGSPAAERKNTARKVSGDALGAIAQVNREGARAASVQVTNWVPEGKKSANTPVAIHIELGGANVSNLPDQYRLENSLDQALERIWSDRVWLPDWQFGITTSLTLNAVPNGNDAALRKRELRRLRDVVTDKFPAKRGQNPPDVDVLDWVTVTIDTDQGPTDVARAGKAVVSFGSIDVTDLDVRRAFEAHFDALTNTNDWRFEWNPPQGIVTVTAVEVLPPFVAFPEVGTPEFEQWNRDFRAGQINLGPAKGGYITKIDLNKAPHFLVGGSTGKGKSVLLTVVLFGALYNPDVVELIVVDPKVTDFTWVGGYPNVRSYAPTDARTGKEQIATAVRMAFDVMESRQNLISMYPGVRNLKDLRAAIRAGKITDLTLADVPKRLILFFDEGGAAFTPSKDPDVKAWQDQARTDMENIAMLGRALEVNIFMAAQKPSAENIGTAMRTQLNNKMAVGYLDPSTSTQVLGSTLATSMLNEADPKGRGVFTDDQARELIFQCYFLPDETFTVEAAIATPGTPDGPDVTVTGVTERVKERLEDAGWESIVSNVKMIRVPESGPDKGSPVDVNVQQSKWVHRDRVE